jgi:hypothetical protein
MMNHQRDLMFMANHGKRSGVESVIDESDIEEMDYGDSEFDFSKEEAHRIPPTGFFFIPRVQCFDHTKTVHF